MKAPFRRKPTVEWQVCGVCNYDCSYCIQSKKSRVGYPEPQKVNKFIDFFARLQGPWEIKMSGGEPFAFKDFMARIIPGLVERTTHRISVLTNLSAPKSILQRFAQLTGDRLGIVSASFHQEFTGFDEFLEKVVALRGWMHPQASLVVNSVLVPATLHNLFEVRERLQEHGLKLFPQWLKTKHGRHEYGPEEQRTVTALVGHDPTPREANLAPNYRGRLCWTGVEYFVVTQDGEVWSCRTARRHKEGYLGNVFRDDVRLRDEPLPCSYDICPCTVPANRGMIEGIPRS